MTPLPPTPPPYCPLVCRHLMGGPIKLWVSPPHAVGPPTTPWASPPNGTGQRQVATGADGGRWAEMGGDARGDGRRRGSGAAVVVVGGAVIDSPGAGSRNRSGGEGRGPPEHDRPPVEADADRHDSPTTHPAHPTPPGRPGGRAGGRKFEWLSTQCAGSPLKISGEKGPVQRISPQIVRDRAPAAASTQPVTAAGLRQPQPVSASVRQRVSASARQSVSRWRRSPRAPACAIPSAIASPSHAAFIGPVRCPAQDCRSRPSRHPRGT